MISRRSILAGFAAIPTIKSLATERPGRLSASFAVEDFPNDPAQLLPRVPPGKLSLADSIFVGTPMLGSIFLLRTLESHWWLGPISRIAKDPVNLTTCFDVPPWQVEQISGEAVSARFGRALESA